MNKTQSLYSELNEKYDLYFTIGTTSRFPYIREPVHKALHTGAPVVEIDPGRTEVSEIVGIKTSSSAIEALEDIWQDYLGQGR